MTTIDKIKRFFARSTRFGLMAAAGLMAGGASAAGFDDKTLVTNDWFDASFTGLTVDTSIAQGDTTGIMLGAGSWTSVPASATAQIVADAEEGEGATLLAINVDIEDLLTFSPAPFSITSGYETVAVDIKTDPVYELPALDNGVQGAFLIYMDGEETLSLQGYTANGWTNLVYAAVSDLTNVWMTVYTDYATVSNVRYVRYSVNLGDSLTILHDSSDTTWFPSAAANKKSLESVSFTGSGKIRTFSGKELQEAVASYNGVNYGTVAAAIAAAEEGGTVTLVKGATEAALSITKDITLDLAEKTTSIPYISIASGKTLTLKRANKQNLIGYFTGGGNLVVAGNNSFRWEGMSGTTTLASITQENSSGGISILGYGTINVSGAVTINAKLTITPSPYSSDSADTHEIYLNAESVSVGELAGAGVISTTDGVTANTGSFSGKITGEGGLTANGSSGLTLSGLNSFAGALNVGENANLTISSSLDGISTMFQLDASDEDSIVLNEDNYVTNWLSQVNNYSFSKDASIMTVTTDYFGGKKAVRTNKSELNSSFTVSSSRFSSSIIAAVRLVEAVNGGGSMILGANGTSNYYIGRRGTGSDQASWKKMNGSKNENTDGFWQSGVYGDRTFHTDKERTLVALNWSRNTNMTTEYVGGGASDIAIAEIIGFDRTNPDIATIKRIEAYLANKWGMTDMGTHLPAADVTVAAGGVLDLGGTTQTVASFTGAGTVQNGTLITTDNVYTNTGALTIPAVNDMTIVLDAGATSLTLVGDATNVSVTATDAFIASGATITVTASAIHTEGHSIDFSGIPSDIFRYGYIDNDDGTWSVGVQTSGFTAATYIWSPVGSSTDWTSLANWSVDGYESVATLPQSVDTVVFPVSEEPGFSGWTVALGENRTVAAMRFNDATALSGALAVCSDVTAASSNVKVTLGNDAGFQDNAANLTLANMSFEVSASHENPARFYMYNNTYKIESTCKITGTGAVTFGVERDSTGIEIKADMTEFEGKATITGARLSAYRSNTSIAQQASSSNAVWYVANGSKQSAFFSNGGVTYYFGSLSGSISHNYQSTGSDSAGFGYRMEIGNRGLDDALGGRYFSATYTSRIAQNKYQPILRKVGGGTLTFTGTEVAKYEVNGGVLYCKANSAFETYWSVEEKTQPYSASFVADGQEWHTPITFAGEGGTLKLDEAVTLDLSTNFVNSTKPVSIDDGGVDRTWTGVIAVSNTGGLTKKGAGKLTLSAKPLYTGATTVEEGTLVVEAGEAWSNYTLGANTKVTVSGTTYTFACLTAVEKPEADEHGVITVPDTMDGVSAVYNIKPGETINCSALTTDARGIKATVSTTVGGQTVDMTNYYTPDSLGVVNGSVTPQLNEAVVGVDFGKEGDTVEPVVFTGSAPAFQLKECVKKGLFYSVGTITDPLSSDISDFLAETQAGSDGQEISLTTDSPDFSGGNVIYYKLSVSDTKQMTE